MKNYLLNCLFVFGLSLGLFSCTDKDEFGPSIFDTKGNSNPQSASFVFDNWLKEAYLLPYNLDFRYKMEDIGSDQNYNLVPTSFAKSQEMAKLIKYLWFDVYAEIVRPDFLKENGPRIIHLIGSPAYNPLSGTILLGTAEGGLKVTLYSCNNLDATNVEMLNEYYFKTMHHEFAHILHQKKNYPVEFGLISQGKYNPLGWQDRTDSQAASLGFVSPYAGSQVREDFVEIIANYLVKNDAQWENILLMASKAGLNNNNVPLPDDGVDGKALILQKLAMAKKWLNDAWNIDLEALRTEIIRRQENLSLLMNAGTE